MHEFLKIPVYPKENSGLLPSSDGGKRRQQMGRHRKTGLDYYYKDVHEWDDIRMIDLMETYGPAGYVVFDVIRSAIYQNGYFLELPADKLAILVTRAVGRQWLRDRAFVEEVIGYCGRIGLFDYDLLEQSVVTSVDIQKHYDDVSARRKTDKSRYWLVPPAPEEGENAGCEEEPDAGEETTEDALPCVSGEEIPLCETEPADRAENAYKKPDKNAEMLFSAAKMQQSKEKQRKEKKSKLKQSKTKQSKAEPPPAYAEKTADGCCCRRTEEAYYAVTGKRMNREDRSYLAQVFEEGMTDAHIAEVIREVGGRCHSRIHSFHYFLPALRESASPSPDTGSGWEPSSLDTRDIEAILDAEMMAIPVGDDSEYVYDD